MKTTMFYRETLSQSDKKHYDKILDGLLNHDSVIQLDSLVPNVIEIVDYTRYDNPQLFDANSITYQSGTKTILYPNYEYSKEEYLKIRAKCIEISQNIVKNVSGTPYEKELQIHDWMCNNLIYLQDSQGAHSIVGPLIYGKGVCEGFSKLFKLLMDMLDCSSLYISGYHLKTNLKVPHSWNAILLEKKWYHVDVTFDNTLSDGRLRHDYFNIPNDLLNKDHKSESYNLIANDYTNNFYYKNGLLFNNIKDVCVLLSRLYSPKQFEFEFMLIDPNPDDV